MPTHTLHSDNMQQVSSFQTLETIIDTPDQGARHLLVFTGIAASRWDSRGELDPLTVIIKLGAVLPQTPNKGDWTATVGLSNIDDRDGAFLFAINSTSLDRDAKTGELELVVEIAVQGVGGRATLNSFTFQVTVLTEPPKIELDSLLVSQAEDPASFGPSVAIETGFRWRGQVSLKQPAPRDVDVFIFSGNPSAAPLRVPGDPAVTSVTIKKRDLFSPPFTAAPTFNPTNLEVDVTISAVVVSGSKKAVVKVTAVPN